MTYKLVLGLEIHMHLKTERKMFCGCGADIYESDPNTHTCPACLGLPGALPVPNLEAVKKTQLLGLALGSVLNTDPRFDRKHYFYPDLPKGYQISQYEKPLCVGGKLKLDSGRIAEIERVHLEEDTAKSFHVGDKTYVDFNKSGIPLVEMVTKPCFTTVEDAVDFARKVRDIAKYSLKISDADMEKGQLRIEPNLSLRTEEMEKNNKLPDYKVEIKNINSFRFMERAVRAEVKRQNELLQKGKKLVQENRGYDENQDITLPQRSKEEAQDYRYFPEPDIPPMEFDKSYMSKLKSATPMLPADLYEDLVTKYKVKNNSARMLTSSNGLELLDQFYEVVEEGVNPEKAANLILNKLDYRGLTVKEFLEKLKKEEGKLDDEDQLEKVVEKVIKENPDVIDKYKMGNENVLQYLLGQVMKKTKGKADPVIASKILSSHLE